MAEITKYLLIFLIMFYTCMSFHYFRYHDSQRQEKVCQRLNIVMFFIHLISFSVLYLKSNDDRMILLYLAQMIFLIAYIGLYHLFYPKRSGILVSNMCMLLSVGFIILTRLSFERSVRQFAIVGAAAILTMMIPLIINKVWHLAGIAWVYGVLGLFLLVVVWVIGNNSYGAQLSISIAGVQFQPSEFVKISFVFFVAAMFYRSTDFHTVVMTTGMAAAHVLVLVLSKDLGSALIFFLTYLVMLFVATTNWLYLGTGVFAGCGASVIAYASFGHVRNRVLAWWNPWVDIDNRGYQITQSLFAMGTGGWFGMGLYQGMPYKIPVVEKDFIFAAISEEMGGIFALCILLISLGCFLQFMMIAGSLKAMFYKLIAVGLGMVYIVQVFLTVGGVIKFIPSTGVTLPFISYGGSSIVMMFILFGVLQGLFILKKIDEEEYEERRTKSKSK